MALSIELYVLWIYVMNSHKTFSEPWCALDRLSHLLPENLISNNFKITFFFFLFVPSVHQNMSEALPTSPTHTHTLHDMLLHTCISLMYMNRPVPSLCIDYVIYTQHRNYMQMSGHVFRSNLFALLQRRNSNLYTLSEKIAWSCECFFIEVYVYHHMKLMYNRVSRFYNTFVQEIATIKL